MLSLRESELPSNSSYVWGKNMKLIQEFIESGYKVAEVMPDENESQRKTKNIASSIAGTISKQKFKGVRVSVRADMVFLIRVPVDEA